MQYKRRLRIFELNSEPLLVPEAGSDGRMRKRQSVLVEYEKVHGEEEEDDKSG